MECNLKNVLRLILYNALIHYINKSNVRRSIVISAQEKQQKPKQQNEEKIYRQIIHNFSPNVLSRELCIALSYGLDIHIPSNTNINKVYTEF